MKEIRLTQGFVALVDDEDFEELSKHKWSVDKGRNTYYAKRSVWIKGVGGSKSIRMHTQIAATIGSKSLVDHRNGNGLDNRRENLRVCTVSQNNMNQQIKNNNTSGFKGVVFDKSKNKFMTRIKHDGKYRFVGRYDTAVEAAVAYNNAASFYYGEFARLNEIPI